MVTWVTRREAFIMVDFHALDYTVLVMTLTVYLGIGIYFGRKRQGSREYTSAGGELGALPVGLSIAVTTVSVMTVQVRQLHHRVIL